MHKPRGEAALRLLLYGGMFFVTLLSQLRLANDSDFFWHLKTGEWIWQHRELPAQDPFNFRSQTIEPARQRFVLTSYWLSQIVYYGIHVIWGIPGIVALRILIVTLLALALVKLGRGDPVVHAALVLAVLLLLNGHYSFDRPWVFSFLFFAVLLLLLEKERTATRVPSGWSTHLALPLLMLVWANMHGGHAVGQVLILLYLALEGIKFLHPVLHPAGSDRYRRLLIAGSGGLFASFINPNSYHALGFVLFSPKNWIEVADYLPTLQVSRELDQPLLLLYWGALALTALACLFTIRKPDITGIALLAGTGYAGFSHFRHIPFFMIAAVPVIGVFLSTTRAKRWTKWALVAGSVALAVNFSRSRLPSRETVGKALRVNSAVYPVQAADFVVASGLKGNLYNINLWGGYLLWRLGPERKVFVDGRGINPQANFDSAAINMAFVWQGESTPYWKNLLNQYGVGFLIIPRDPSRREILFEDIGLLTEALLADTDWIPVFADETALVFVRNTEEHREVITLHGIPKNRPLGWWLGR